MRRIEGSKRLLELSAIPARSANLLVGSGGGSLSSPNLKTERRLKNGR